MSITVRLDQKVKAAITQISDDGWTKIKYTKSIYDPDTGKYVSVAEVHEIRFTAFTSRAADMQVPARLVVRRIPDLNPKRPDQPSLFDVWRFHAFFTTTPADQANTVTADKTHRQRAIIENVHAT